MLTRTHRRPFRPTPRIIVFALVDIIGMLMLTLGGSYLAQGRAIFFPRVPGSAVEAWFYTVLGTLVMFWAVVQIIRELMLQTPRTPRSLPSQWPSNS